MSPESIIEFYEGLIDDTQDPDIEYGLMDAAYTKRNELRTWAMLMKLDSSISHSPSDTWQTEKSLPTDFGSTFKLFGGASDNEYDAVPFVNLIRYKDSPNAYTIDLVNNKMRLTGSVTTALTMYHYYQYVPTSLFGLSEEQKQSTTTIVWPARFHRLLAYDMASLQFGGIDADETTRKMEPAMLREARALQSAMISWDNRNFLKLMGESSSPRHVNKQSMPDVVDW